ncbi:MAG: radical SAM protein [Synergistaceae bacterium]|nr:radical SAM protein [Synergistaceae bacterium]
MANLGFHYIYRVLRELGVSAERFFTSPVPYRSVERDTLLERFPLVLGSISYETGVLEFARWLAGGNMSPSRRLRSDVLVGAGGAVTYINPLSLSAICDFIVLGDGIQTARFMVETLRRGLPREKILAVLAEHPSIYVPSIHEHGRHYLIKARDGITGGYGRGTWTTPLAAFGDTLLLELQRGCVRGCRFCTLSYCFGPKETRGVNFVKRDIEEANGRCDFSRIGLVTPEAGDYADLDELLEFAERLGKGVSFASLRVEGLSERMVRALAGFGRRNVTIAPESGDDELRKRCGKLFTNRDLIEKLKMAKDCGARGVKMYFMFGLPGETDGQLSSISKLCARVREETGLSVAAAVSPFIPKPGTPWAEEMFDGERKLKLKYSMISKSFGMPGVKLQCGDIKEACLEYAISWAETNASELIANTATSGGSYGKLESLSNKGTFYAEHERLGLRG